MNISTTDARALFTKMLIDVYKERTTPTSFLRSFFPTVESPTKEISIEVVRGTEKIAVDVARGTEGNRNSFSNSTEKIFVPPYFREYFDATELDLYDRLFAEEGTISADIMSAFIDSVAEKLRMLQDKIERAYELQCAQVLVDGIVILKNGTNINFKRKAGSLVDLNGSTGYWSVNGHDVFKDFENGVLFLRTKGKAQGGTFNAIMGSAALAALLSNSVFKERNNLVNLTLDAVTAPQFNAVGATLHGQITAGSYRINLWAYPEFYDNESGVSTPYIDDTKVVLIPEKPRFKLAFAAVPRLLKAGAPVVKGAFLFGEYMDEKNSAHIMDVKSAGVAIPVAVDQIYTMKVLA